MSYIKLSEETERHILEDRLSRRLSPYACPDDACLRRDMTKDKAKVLRPAFVRDTEKIMNIPYYLRYSDKTQVFSFHKNDDISRRSYHVQLVARIARNIGSALNLNLDLIEAIALGHDLGHTPFGHAGEKKLNEIYNAHTGRFFNHNIQSARILDTIFPVNISLQTLDGIICHNGEMELREYRPSSTRSFEDFDAKMSSCLTTSDGIKKLSPGTLEGCVVRVSDIIAYLGKDRQDAIKLGFISDDSLFSDLSIGRFNAEIINNMTVNLVENSYGQPFLKMDPDYYEAFSRAKKENYALIYQTEDMNGLFDNQIYPMFDEVYDKLREDLVSGKKDSPVFTHHLDYIREYSKYYDESFPYQYQDPDDIVTDFIASMTDDFFVDLYEYLFPGGGCQIAYKGYF